MLEDQIWSSSPERLARSSTDNRYFMKLKSVDVKLKLNVRFSNESCYTPLRLNVRKFPPSQTFQLSRKVCLIQSSREICQHFGRDTSKESWNPPRHFTKMIVRSCSYKNSKFRIIPLTHTECIGCRVHAQSSSTIVSMEAVRYCVFFANEAQRSDAHNRMRKSSLTRVPSRVSRCGTVWLYYRKFRDTAKL